MLISEGTGEGIARDASEALAMASSTPPFIIHRGGGGFVSSETQTGRRWGVSEHRCYAGVHHNNANRTKKSKRKQAQASRRKNRG